MFLLRNSPILLNWKHPKFFFKLQFSPHLFSNCISVLKFFTALVQGATQANTSLGVKISLVQRPHGSLYKTGYCTCQGEVHRISAKSQTAHKFSLSFQLDQNHNKLKKLKNIFENPNNFPEAIQAKINGVCVALRDSIESSSLSLVLRNSSIRFVAESNKP